MEIRPLRVEEWEEKVSPAYREMGLDLPNPRRTIVYGAEKEGRTAGILVYQFLPHAEPLFVYPEFRDQRVGWSLYDYLDARMPAGTEYYVTMQNEGLIEQAYKRGMVSIPGMIMAKEFK
jgi:hypothetical protein